MARPSLDLLPLLDVFMVVLFVFATIQEQRLDDSTRGAVELARRAQAAELALAQAQAQTQAKEAERQGADRQRQQARDRAEREAEDLRRELQQARQALAEYQRRVQQNLEQLGVPAEALERIEILSRVLDKYSVFEIEIIGHSSEGGEIINRCCFRIDPLDDRWSSCGVVPATAPERTRWIEGGAGGLSDALRRTKGGNAMTLVRQDHAAAYRIASRWVEQLRREFSDQHFYPEESPFLPDHCGD